MSVLATDNFNRTNAGTLGADWTDIGATPISVAANQAVAAGTDFISFNYWNAIAFPSNQYSQFVIGTGSIGKCYWDAAVRVADVNNYYGFDVTNDGNTYNLYSTIGGAFNLLASGAYTPASGDTIRCDAKGSTIRGLINGAVVASVTDTNLTTGRAGITPASVGIATVTLDNWEGGDFGLGLPRIIIPRQAVKRASFY